MSVSPTKNTKAPAEEPERRAAEAARRLHGVVDELEGDGAQEHAGPEAHDQPEHLRRRRPARTRATIPASSDEAASSPHSNASTTAAMLACAGAVGLVMRRGGGWDTGAMTTRPLVIRNGLVIDGTGAPAVRADVAIRDGVITEVGAGVDGTGADVIDADGLVVTPGFVDIHTHFDGQATWDPLLAPSSIHGVTSIVMGNCGVGFAPAHPTADQHDWLIGMLEGVEDIPGTALAEGLAWDWETFPDYLDALARRRFALDVGTHVTHAPLRAYVMGERGADPLESPTADELVAMAAAVRDGIARRRPRLHDQPHVRPPHARRRPAGHPVLQRGRAAGARRGDGRDRRGRRADDLRRLPEHRRRLRPRGDGADALARRAHRTPAVDDRAAGRAGARPLAGDGGVGGRGGRRRAADAHPGGAAPGRRPAGPPGVGEPGRRVPVVPGDRPAPARREGRRAARSGAPPAHRRRARRGDRPPRRAGGDDLHRLRQAVPDDRPGRLRAAPGGQHRRRSPPRGACRRSRRSSTG